MANMGMKEKAQVYDLFASIFAKEPTAALLSLLQKEKPGLLLDLKEVDPSRQTEALAVEYTRLFIWPAVSTSLCESIQRGEGRLCGKATAEVDAIYRKFGFRLDDSFKDTPDHLSAELAFLAELSKLESKFEKDGLIESAFGVLQVKKYFLKNHLLSWFPQFKENVEREAEFSYYKEASRLLYSFLEDELESLKDIEGVIRDV